MNKNKVIRIAFLSGLVLIPATMFYMISKRRTKLTDEILDEIGDVTETSVEGYKKYFNKNYWRGQSGDIPQGTNYVLLKTSKVTELRDKIFNSMDGLGTNESRLYSTLSSLDDMVQLSQISDSYTQRYDKSMFKDIIDELNKKENYELADALIGKPKYRIQKS
jgi:hypothetical protein